MTYTVIDTPAKAETGAADGDMLRLRTLLSTISSVRKELEPYEEEMAIYVFRTLYIAREFLNNQKGQRKDRTAEDYIAYTWNDYCQEIGASRQTVNNWLKNFTPAELSEDGKDHIRMDKVRNVFWGTLVWAFCKLDTNAACILEQASRPTGLVPDCEQPEDDEEE